MYEDRTQNYDPDIHEKYLIYMLHPFHCHNIIYSHVQTIA